MARHTRNNRDFTSEDDAGAFSSFHFDGYDAAPANLDVAPAADAFPLATATWLDAVAVLSAASAAKPTGSIAALADYLVNGFWQFNSEMPHHWGSTTITYNINALTTNERFLAQSALNAWHEVTNLNFVLTTGVANITYTHNGTMTAYETDTFDGSGIMSSATINISADWITNDGGAYDGKTGIDSYGYQTYVHETGHALGLGHQGPYNGSASYSTDAIYANDTWQYSVMSYFAQQNLNGGSYRYVVTPQMADIYAAASIYGAATTRTGDTVYGFHNTAGSIFDFTAYSSAPALTLYDSGGLDTLDCSGYSVAQLINLHSGSFSSVGGLVQNIGIATTTVIEVAIGGGGNDTLIANDFGCTLQGGAGNDNLAGGAGSDFLIGGTGIDTMTGGGGVDVFRFLAGYSSAASGQRDRIDDFTTGTDRIDLSGMDAVTSTAGVDTFTFLWTAAFNGVAGVLNYSYDSQRGVTVLQGDTNGDRAADFAVDLAGNIILSTDDLIGIAWTATVIETNGSIQLTERGNHYFLQSGGTGPSLKFQGSDFIAGQLGQWLPIGAEQTAGGYKVALKITGSDTYGVWYTDSTGNVVSGSSAMSGADYALESFEPGFQQDLNGDGHVGSIATVIEALGSIQLTERGNHFFLDNGGIGPSLKFGGSDFVAGQLGLWTPIGAEQTAGGYEVALKIAGSETYGIWYTDSSGNVVSGSAAMSGSDYALESLEPGFQQDLNGDGQVGLVPTVIEAFGSTQLTERGNHFFLDNGSLGPSLKFGGSDFVAGQLGLWSPIGAEQATGGYKVALKITGSETYGIWYTDSNGNVVSGSSAMSGADYALESFEPGFQQDLNGDGNIGVVATVIEAFGSTQLTERGNHFFLDNGSIGPSLKFAGGDFVAGQLGLWSPIGAEQTASGYEVALKITGSDTYGVWYTDSNGNVVSGSSAMSGTDYALEVLEPGFQQDLNGDGQVGLVATVIEAFGSTQLTERGNHFFLDNGSIGPSLKFQGSDFIAGQLGFWSPIGAEQTASGYEVALKITGADTYGVWYTDSNGNVVSGSSAMSGTDYALKSLEPGFQQDLNGDGTVGLASPVIASSKVQGATVNDVSTGSDYSVVTGSAGSDTFVFSPNFGNTTITNFQPGHDIVQFDHTTFADMASLVARMADDGHGNVTIEADLQDVLTLEDVTTTALLLHLSDFHIV